MWKLIGGILLAIVILVIGVVYWGYKKLQAFASETGPVTITIGAPVDRVFSVIGNGDSLSLWMAQGGRLRVNHHGPLRQGDTITVETATFRDSVPREQHYVVGDVKAPRSINIEMRAGRTDQLAAIRHFEVTARGDSTEVVASATSTLADSIAKIGDAKSGMAKSAIDMSSKLMLAGFRLQNDVELQRLKQHLDGTKPKYKTP